MEKILKEKLLMTKNDQAISHIILSFLTQCEMCEKFDECKDKNFKVCYEEKCKHGCKDIISYYDINVCKDCYKRNKCDSCEDVMCGEYDYEVHCDNEICERMFCDECSNCVYSCDECKDKFCCKKFYRCGKSYYCVDCVMANRIFGYYDDPKLNNDNEEEWSD